jgi:hypothetical protein
MRSAHALDETVSKPDRDEVIGANRKVWAVDLEVAKREEEDGPISAELLDLPMREFLEP